MKYKVGDKVRIKEISGYTSEVKHAVKQLENRIAIITKVDKDGLYPYYVNNWRWHFPEEYLEECKSPIYEPIHSRFEILDIR